MKRALSSPFFIVFMLMQVMLHAGTVKDSLEMANFASDGDSMAVNYNIPSMPGGATLDSVVLNIHVAGDMNDVNEYATIAIDGIQIGGILSSGEQDCNYDNGHVIIDHDVSSFFLSSTSLLLKGYSSINTDSGSFACSNTAVRIKWIFTYYFSYGYDLEVVSWDYPTGTFINKVNDSPVITIKNNDQSHSQTNVTVGYSLDGGTTYSFETITNAIPPNTSYTHTFSSTPIPFGNLVAKAFVHDTTPVGHNDTIGPVVLNNNPLPYFQSFDSSPDLPAGWHFIRNMPSNAYVEVRPSYSYSGSNSLQMYNSMFTAGDLIAIAPEYCSNISHSKIRFYAAGDNEYNGENLIIGVMTDSSDATTFTPVDTAVIGLNYQQYEISLKNYTGNGQYLAFKHSLPANYARVVIDDFQWLSRPDHNVELLRFTAPKAKGLFNNTETVSVMIKNNGVLPTTSINVKYSIDNGQSWATENASLSIASGDSAVYNFNSTADFSAAGFYNCLAVASVNGDTVPEDDTASLLLYSLSPVNLPFSEDFSNVGPVSSWVGEDEMILNGSPLWSFHKGSIDGRLRMHAGAGFYHSGNAAATMDRGNLPDTNRLILDLPIAAYAGSQLELSFWFMEHSDENHDGDKVWVRGSHSDPWAEAYNISPYNVTDGTWQQVTVDIDQILSNAGQTVTNEFQLMFGQKDNNYSATSPTQTDGITYDDILLQEIFPNDIGITAINLHPVAISLQTSTIISLDITNAGTQAQNNITLKYSTDGGSNYTSALMGVNINPGDTLTFTFSTPADFSATGVHNLIAVVDHNGDSNPGNDTLMMDITNFATPYIQNFDNVSAPGLPEGWSSLNQTTGHVETNNYTKASGPNSLNIFNGGASAGQDLFAIMPPYYGNYSGKWISFDVNSETTQDSLIVGVLTNPANGSTFTGIDTVIFNKINSWKSHYSLLSGYSGTGKYIAFRHTSTDSYEDIFIDNLILKDAPSGPVFAVNPDSINMGRVGYNQTDTMVQMIEVTNEGIGTLNVSSINISGPQSGSFQLVDTNSYPKALQIYESLKFKVKFFGSSIGIKNATINITANSSTEYIPLLGEVFDITIDSFPHVEHLDYSGNFPSDWNMNAGSSYSWNMGKSTPTAGTGAPFDHTTGNGWFVYTESSFTGYNDQATLVSPPVDFSSLTNPKMSFWYFMYGQTMGDIYVDVSISGTWIAIDSIIGQQQSSQADPWYFKKTDLSLYQSADSIRIRAMSNGSYLGDISLDDIAFGEDPHIDLGPDTSICQGETITFHAGTQSGWTYRWYEGNSTTVAGTGATFTTSTTGTYRVEVSTAGGFSSADTIQLSVDPLPVVNFPALQNVCTGSAAVNLNMATPAGGIYSGPGVFGGNFNPSATGAGNYTLTYSFTDFNGCSSSDSTQITVFAEPVISAMATPNPLNYGSQATLDVTVNGTSSYSYQWSPADSLSNPGNASIKNPATKALTQPTLFSVDVIDNNTGCASSDDVYVSIIGGPMTLTVAASSDTVCSGDSVNLFAWASGGSGTYTYSWTSKPVGFSSNISNPAALVNTKTTFYVNISDGITTLSDSLIINARTLPQPTFTGLSSEYCEIAQNILLSGHPAGGLFSGNGISGNSFNPLAAGTGSHNITYTYMDQYGCTGSSSQNLLVKPLPMVSFSGLNTDYCQDDPASILNGSPAGGAFSGSGITGNSFTPASAGSGMHMIYYDYTAANGCSNTDSATVTVHATPNINASAIPNPVSYGNSTNLDVTVGGIGTFSYSWSPADSLFNPSYYNLKSPGTKTLTKPTLFEVVVTDNTSGCSNYDNVFVSILGGPVTASPATQKDTVCVGETVTVYANASGGNGTYLYSWSSNPSGFTSSSANPQVTPVASTTYIVSVTDGISTAVDSVRIITRLHPEPDINGLAAAYCNTDAASVLSGIPAGGSFGGTGISGSSFHPASAGTGTHLITYNYTDAYGCSGQDTDTTQVYEMPVIDLGSDTAICAGSSITIDASTTATSYNWSTGETTSDIIYQPISSGPVWVVVTNEICQASDTLNIQLSKPQVDLGPDTTICHDQSLTLYAPAGYQSYLWSTGFNGTSITVDSASFGIGSTTVSLLVTDSLGCTDLDAIIITIDDCTGIGKHLNSSSLEIYPNPGKGIFTLDIKQEPSAISELCIFSYTGQKILCKQLKMDKDGTFLKTYDLSTQPKGIYLIRISSGNMTSVKRLVIE